MGGYAGWLEGIGTLGRPSQKISWNSVVQYRPEIIVLSPCGYDLKGVKAESYVLASYPDWDKIPAYKNSKIYAVNASAYFSRPGPRVVDGLELLARSEERRVGKECRCRWWPCQCKTKEKM